GGLFVDGIVNGDILTGEWNIPSLGVGAAPWTTSSHVNTWGAQLETGYAIPLGSSAFIEPVGSIAYGRTTTGRLDLALGATQSFGNSDTLRGSLGGRVGTTSSFQYYKVKLALEGRVWDEFDGKTNTALANAGATFLNANDISGVYGEVKGEANLFAAGDHLSAFLNAGVKWKARYQDTSVSLGVRYQW
ncbi:MAG: autotransporter outer membrane beta-barrel domain-containing protein, partial [Proteobacteria bacterium]|nr:autotransporter outer membrane beta-barrel domain-containing protein [Pseudomonadota bacterium]